MSDKSYSESVSEFLNFIRDACQQHRIAITTQQEAEAETQDILHSLELEEHSYNEVARLGKRLAEVRKQRRSAKDMIVATSPIVEWQDQNATTIKAIERLLGDIRKGERYVENRIFTPRTQVLEAETCVKQRSKKAKK